MCMKWKKKQKNKKMQQWCGNTSQVGSLHFSVMRETICATPRPLMKFVSFSRWINNSSFLPRK